MLTYENGVWIPDPIPPPPVIDYSWTAIDYIGVTTVAILIIIGLICFLPKPKKSRSTKIVRREPHSADILQWRGKTCLTKTNSMWVTRH
jgi:hypothetical protein